MSTRVRMRLGISGAVEGGTYENVCPGDVIDVQDDRARIWIQQKLCIPVDPSTPITTARLKGPSAHY